MEKFFRFAATSRRMVRDVAHSQLTENRAPISTGFIEQPSAPWQGQRWPRLP